MVVALIGGAAACGPSADRGLAYTDVDAKYLEDTLVVVAASRANTTPFGMEGATLFVRASGDIARIDNDGMDSASMAYASDVVGFSDRHHDYLLGSRDPVRARAEVPETQYASFLLDGRLVSLFNGGFGEEAYELVVSETATEPEVRAEAGYVESAAACDDGIWAVLNPDTEGLTERTSRTVRRVSPEGTATWTLNFSPLNIGVRGATCSGSRLVALGDAYDDAGERNAYVVVDLDVRTGKSTTNNLTGDLDPPGEPDGMVPADMVDFEALALTDEGLSAVVVETDGDDDRRSLVRIDPSTGVVTTVAQVETVPDADTLVRVQDDTLYVLDSTRETKSQLRAYALDDGQLIARVEFDALRPRLNGRFTSFDRTQFVRDFAVTTPAERW